MDDQPGSREEVSPSVSDLTDKAFVKIARALADPTRARMLREIRKAGELNCSQVLDRFDLSQPTISHHIKILAEAGLVACRKAGPFHVMQVDEEVVNRFAAAVVLPGANASPTSPTNSAKKLTRKTGKRTGT